MPAVSCPEPDAWLCPDDALVAHLDGCAECRGLAGLIARTRVLEIEANVEPLVPELLPSGAQLGRYVVRGAIGAGGMGVVLEAHDPKLDRRVALKVVRRLRDDAGWLRAKTRVLAEAQAMARLAHPNVVAIHDLVEIGDEHLIAMEYVDGPDLDAWLAGTPPPADRLRAVIEAGRGLAAAHDAGVIHRDIKPSNILIGGDGRARVTDFGLAALGGEPATGAIGTPGFVAPEVAAGGAIDARADQYAFAVTAWRALFDAEPGERGHGRIAHVLERALATDPAARWPSLHELVRALERRDRRRGVAIAVSLGVVAVAAGALWFSRADASRTCSVDAAPIWSPAVRTRWLAAMQPVAGTTADTLAADVDRAWQGWIETSRAACDKPAYVRDCLASTQHQLAAFVEHAPASKHASAAQHALAGIPSASTCLRSPVQRALTATTPEVRFARAPFQIALDEVKLLSNLGQYDAARARLDPIVAHAPTFDPALTGELLYRKADLMSRMGETPASVPVLEQALAIAERSGNDVARLNTIIALLEAYEELGEEVKASALAHVAEAAAQRVPRDPNVMARLESVLGSLGYNAGDHAVAERHWREVLRLQQELHGPADPTIAGALHNLGMAVHLAGRRDEAIEIEQRSLAMFEATVGSQHPDTALPVTELAGIALEQNRVDDAIALYRRGLAIREQGLGADHPFLAETLVGLARVEAQAGHHDAAIGELRRACKLGAAMGEQHPLVATAEYYLAAELDDRGERTEALALLEHAQVAWDASQIALPEAAYTRFMLAEYRWRAGDHAHARALAKQAHAALVQLAAPYASTAREVETWIAKH